MKAKTRKILIIIACVLIALISIRMLFIPNTLMYGIILLAGLALAYLIWRAFIRNSREELRQAERRENLLTEQINALNQTVTALQRELEEKNNSKINVIGLSPIMHVAVLSIDSSFTRPFIRKKDNMTFYGALRADISAEYGIKMEDVLYKYDGTTNSLYLKNFHPGLISYSKKQLNWEFADGYKSINFFGKDVHLPADGFTKEMTDELRRDLEKEIDERKIEEFDWLSPMLSTQVGDMFKLMLNHPEADVIVLQDDPQEALPEGQDEDDQGFLRFKDFKNLPAAAEAIVDKQEEL
jgi:hypothetical protein